ncbi:MAG: sigma-70 family RNA polymerase sigma factor [Kiritimatiellae bacterium]|nr:sigma-70 family RNA polymerase sigma factor [Kiritimatiellia bacterium]
MEFSDRHDGGASDADLLAQFLAEQAEDAFRVLVERHSGLVYGTCLRALRGDRHLAEDATQAVFVVLARKARSIRKRGSLASWLFRTALSVVNHMKRAEARRRRRELAALAMAEPAPAAADRLRLGEIRACLQEAIGALRPKQQDAVVLHFLEGKTQPEVAALLGCSEDAARFRISYALKKMKRLLSKKGVVLSGAALAGQLAAESAEAASAGLAAACHSAAMTGLAGSAELPAAVAAAADAVARMMLWAKVKTTVAMVSTAALVGFGGPAAWNAIRAWHLPGRLVPGIPIQPDTDAILTVKKVPVCEGRVVRGFCGRLVDGTTRSRDYSGHVSEYAPHRLRQVRYGFNGNDGAHITLADRDGVDALILRGGARAKLYADCATLTEPEDDRPILRLDGAGKLAVGLFDRRRLVSRASFFDIERGAIADAAFYRMAAMPAPPRGWQAWHVVEREVTLPEPEPGRPLDPSNIRAAMQERYGDAVPPRIVAIAPGTGPGTVLSVRNRQPVHFLGAPVRARLGLSALFCDMVVEGGKGPLIFDVAVQDPLNPRRDVAYVRFAAARPGRFRFVLDFTGQILLEENRVWLTLVFDRDVRLSSPRDGQPLLSLQVVPPADALPEALAWRKLLLKELFSTLSEPRPWGNYRRQSRAEFYALDEYAAQCPELFMTIDQCHALAPADETVRQYREWVFLRNLDKLSRVEPPPAPPPGVPAWAWYPRLAWLEARRIAKWWIDERLVPTGEFGSMIGDDTDLYQQMTDLPLFETDGVAAQAMAAGARLAEFIEEHGLQDGLNRHTTQASYAYEDGLNHRALLARWFYGDPLYLERCMESARQLEKLTVRSEDGRRHFPDSGAIGIRNLSRPPAPKTERADSALLWHPALEVAEYNRHPRILELVRQWADGWVRHVERDRNPIAIDVGTGDVLAWQENKPPLTAGYGQASTFLWLHALTGAEPYARPFLAYHQRGFAAYPGYFADALAAGMLDELAPATRDRLIERCTAAALYWRRDPAGLIKTVIGGQRKWEQAIDSFCDARRWPDMYTTTHQYADRILLGDLLASAAQCMLGGYCKRNKFNPTHAVSWEGFGTEYGALVLENRRDRFEALVYSFADRPVKGRMRVWRLEHGRYKVTVGLDRDRDTRSDAAGFSRVLTLAKADDIPLELEPHAVTTVVIRQLERLEPIFTRPDLAIAARDVRRRGRSVTGVAHNIGASAAGEVEAGIVDANGRVVVRKTVGRLAAPTALRPVRLAFALALPSEPADGWTLKLDPDNRLAEIYEGNNEVPLPDTAHSLALDETPTAIRTVALAMP